MVTLRAAPPALWLALGQVTCWAGLYYSFPALLLHFEHQMGWSRADITLAMTLALVVTALCSPVSGRIIDAGYGRWLLAGSAVLGATGLAALASVSRLSEFYLVWVLIGIAMSGALYEPCFAFIIHHLSHQSARAIGLITLIAGFASTISFPMADYVAQGWGLDRALYGFALMVLLIGAPCSWRGASLLQHSTPAVQPAAASSVRVGPPFYRRRIFWLLSGAFSLAALVQGAMLNHLLPLLSERELPAGQAVLLLTLLGPMQVMGRIVWLLAARRVTPVLAMAVCLATMLVALLVLLLVDTRFAGLLLFMALLSASFGIFYILKPLTTRHFLGEQGFGAMNGAMAVPYLLLFALAPAVGSLVWEWRGYTSLILLLAAAAAIALLLFVVVALTDRAPKR